MISDAGRTDGVFHQGRPAKSSAPTQLSFFGPPCNSAVDSVASAEPAVAAIRVAVLSSPAAVARECDDGICEESDSDGYRPPPPLAAASWAAIVAGRLSRISVVRVARGWRSSSSALESSTLLAIRGRAVLMSSPMSPCDQGRWSREADRALVHSSSKARLDRTVAIPIASDTREWRSHDRLEGEKSKTRRVQT